MKRLTRIKKVFSIQYSVFRRTCAFASGSSNSPGGLSLPVSFRDAFNGHSARCSPEPRRGGLFIASPPTQPPFLFVFQRRGTRPVRRADANPTPAFKSNYRSTAAPLKNKKNNSRQFRPINRPLLRGLHYSGNSRCMMQDAESFRGEDYILKDAPSHYFVEGPPADPLNTEH